MSDTIEYLPLKIDTDDFLRLKAAVADRDPKLRLTLEHTDDGANFILVKTMPLFRGCGAGVVIAHVIRGELSNKLPEGRRRVVRDGRSKIGWMVCYPDNGPLYQFAAIAEVANFLAFGDTQACRGSVAKARTLFRRNDDELCSSLSQHPEERTDVRPVAHPAPDARAATPGRRGRSLPMLGDR
jgi:hypothetical protein